MILILGHTQAGELDLVVRELRELGLPFLRLNLDNLAYTTPLTVALTPDYKLIIHHPVRGNVDISNVSSAWTGYMPYRLLRPMHLDFRIMEAIQSDLLALVMGVAEILQYSGTIWFNSPLKVVQTSKVLQLYLAQKIGFFIPVSLITVDTQMFQSFYSANCRDLIYKSVHAQTVDFGTKWLASYTQVVSEDFVSEFAKARELNAPPILFQKRINKEFEVRI